MSTARSVMPTAPRIDLASLDLASPVTALRGVGLARARALAAAGCSTVGDLLCHLPFRWEDRRAIARVADVSGPGAWTVRGRLTRLSRVRLRRRGFSVVRGIVEDGSGALPVVWFNRPYLTEDAVAGGEWLLHGPVRAARGTRGMAGLGLELLNPSCEPAERALHGARIVPVYPALGEVGPAALRRLLDAVLAAVDPARDLPEHLPAELLERRGLPPLGAALAALHRPGEDADAAALNARQSPAHGRLVYGELLELQLALALARERRAGRPRRHRYRVDDRVRQVAREVLPFRLTAAQKRALREIVADLEGPAPMLRLLQGDVGSGKTIVAALALVVALESGFQGAFMAPTEILAEQHFASLSRLLGHRYRVGLLTGSIPDLSRARADVAAGRLQLAVGTHALIQEGVRFRRLGLAVIDEQHRFGVMQRQLLARKGERPDLLVMTATPIPRSLALTAYGDLDLSVLDELPPGRTPVATEVVSVERRREVYRRLAEAVAAGERAYVVVPLVEESDQVAAASVAEAAARVRRDLPGAPVAVVHGRLPAAEREAAMRAFAEGRAAVLLATTVIEVGVDVPEATWMVIESAERFGLAQLHQLRGRVGRGPGASRCVAIHGRLSEEARQRLEVFAGTTDGFAIAEADLRMRGPGDLLGTRQAGLPALRVADLSADWPWVERAREDAAELLARRHEPEVAALVARVAPEAAERAGEA